MNENPLVSVITPVYNNADFIARCIQSVLNQDYPHIEHIVQDGGSRDGTVAILEKYTGQINWISEPDQGQADGLNRALQRCRGDIIGILNADDEYLPHAASWAVENFAKYPDVAVIYGDQYDIDLNGKIVHYTYGPPYDFQRIFCVEDVIPAQAAFIKRTLFEQVGLYTDITLKTCPDYEMWIRIGLRFQMQHVPGFVAKYRWHLGSESRQGSLIPEFIKAKRRVMERVFSNPATPDSLKTLRKRAFSGLAWWSACTMIGNGDIAQGVSRFLYSIWLYPSIYHQIPRVKSIFMDIESQRTTHQKMWRILSRVVLKSLKWFEKGYYFLGMQR